MTPSTQDARATGLLAAFRFIDREAAIMNGVPNEPSADDADPDDIAIDLAEAFGVPFDENWPEAVARALAASTKDQPHDA